MIALKDISTGEIVGMDMDPPDKYPERGDLINVVFGGESSIYKVVQTVFFEEAQKLGESQSVFKLMYLLEKARI